MSTPKIRDIAWTSHMPDEDWAEVSQGVPAKDEPFINKFLSGREALIGQEKEKRSDHAFRQSLSPIAREACSIVDRIRDEEQQTIWSSEFEDSRAREVGKNVYPGMMFSLAKERMETTKLWQIIKKMPKGALLHAHMDAMVDFDYLIEIVLAEPGMHIYCKHALSTEKERDGADIKFRYFKSEKGADTSIWTSDYKPDTPILLSKAVSSFPNGGKSGFITWLKDRLTITSTESLEHHHGIDAVWRKFTSIFSILNTMMFYEPIFRKFMRRMMQQLLADGVKYVDLRITFTFFYYREGSETPESSYERMFEVFGEEIEKFKASEEGKEFWGCRMIWTSIRALDTRRIIEDMDQCILIKSLFPHLVCGYDLVGQEDLGRPLKDLLPELFWFKKQCAEEGLDIPFFFHAGETLGDGTDTDQNLFDAILLGTRRIGHGFSLYKHPLLIDMVKEKRILVESCPISNEVLRLCATAQSHPLPALLARGVPCSLCNDDPAILGQDTNGQSHDFYQSLQASSNLGLVGLASLAENSVRWAAFEDQSNTQWLESIKQASLGNGLRAERMKQWAVEWEQFCLWVVREWGEDAESLRAIMGEGSMDRQD